MEKESFTNLSHKIQAASMSVNQVALPNKNETPRTKLGENKNSEQN